MRKLKNILKNVNVNNLTGNTDIDINNIVFDSRKVTKGDLFIAVKGINTDGHQYIDKAVNNGARAVVSEKTQNQTYKGVCFIIVDDSADATGLIASNYYDNPSSKLKLTGITGTNGKTTTATLLYRLFLSLGYKAGLISTVKNCINEKEIQAKYTTPDAIEFNRLLNEMCENDCEYCFAEVSSHAISLKRINGLTFSGGVFTNITHDHLDYHKTFKKYIETKKTFFDTLPKEAFALTNIDDKNGEIVLQNTKANKYTYGLNNLSDYHAKVIEKHIEGMMLTLNETEIWTTLTGKFNAYNILCVYAVAEIYGENKEEILTKLSALQPVRGRFETINKNGITAIIDYAHTPDALENVLQTIKDIKNKNQELITVVGTGGDRDKTKRPIMAKIALKYSNKVILTSDNPRTENPECILDDMYKGVENGNCLKVIRITNREEAIKTARIISAKGDIILIAGKGHETYQEINGVRNHFDDKEVILKYL